MDEAPIIYGLEDFQTRALVAQAAETEKINFLVGTQSLSATNQVQVIEYDDDSGLVSKRSYDHPAGEIWRMDSAPQSPDLMATVYNTSTRQVSEAECAVWRLPSDAGGTGLDDSRMNVELVAELQDDGDDNSASSGVRWVGWSNESDARMATLTHSKLLLWQLRPHGEATAVSCMGGGGCGGRIGGGGVGGFGVGRWYPHQQAVQVAATLGSSVVSWDTRTLNSGWTIQNAHLYNVRDLDFNPNLQYNVATCGDDCATKFWDLRKSDTPLLVVKHHSHWVWSVRYNASYDQLVLSCSSDQRVVLANLPSVASMPFADTQQEDDGSTAADKNATGIPEGVIQRYEEHEDSVYAVEWATGDFWTFASLSYDGRLVINKVPRAVKYKQFL
uniref:Protein TSSC1-like n=1 Tax=Hirondellea gigas TaxID=1518452 RepID=A0A2P2I928_9CRUS